MIDPQLDRRVVLVTGGATSIGAAIVRAFSAQGAHVAVHYLAEDLAAPDEVTWEHRTPTADEAEQLAHELDTPAVAIAANLFEPSEIERLFNTVETQLGPVDVLVNNAAHCESPDTIDTITASGLERHYRVNAIAPALLIRELAHRVRSGMSPCAINISTDAARAFPGQIGYGSSKAAVEALTRATALDLAAELRVNAIAPGPVQTGWLTGEVLENAQAIVPMGRVGEPDEIADAAVFLASYQARFITGQVLQVAGGHAL